MRPHDVESKLHGATAKWAKLLSPTAIPPSLPPILPVLPDELIVEILLRLPVRSLLEFRSVCKSWKTLISSSQFAKDHLQCSIADPTITHPRLAYSNRGVKDCKIGFCPIQPLLENPSAPVKVVCFPMGEPLDMLGSCNGLLCLHTLLHNNSVRLWNPCTGFASEWLKIEPTRKRPVTYRGFGYDHVHDKYKALVVLQGSRDSVTKVCTFGANSWTTIRDFPFSPPDPRGKFVSGTLNWIVGVPGTTDRWVILSFDLGKESYGQVSLPDMDGDNLCNPVLEVLRNCLCVCFDHKKTHWDVWLMKDYGVEQSWTKLVKISRVELRPYKSVRSLKPLYISENGLILAKPPYSKLVLYNSNDDQLDYPRIDGSSDGMLRYPMSEKAALRCFHVYHESLVSPSHCGLRSCFIWIDS